MRSVNVRIEESRVEDELIDLMKFRPEALGWHFRYSQVSVAMARGAMTRGDLDVDFIFVYDRDRVNSQIGLPYVPDHHLARLPDAVMSHVVPGLSPRESPAVYVDPLPIFGRTISNKDEV